ncbi:MULTISPECIES: hypothetical protein [Sphingomonadaceae]|jgi:hypothetical protein|uniref:Uncharacterized protein n=4 Tax=Sphingomonadaceae TaxID=41297 RepID=A0A7Y2KP31_SPHPI|nr:MULTISPECIES: hypothetical protein [Sphingomonadaceae]MBN2974337.1 hypothetical protein [Roseomonas aeriglobus]KEQ54806.1 hypothetical protein BV95_01035 [Sphingobium chlorophenolicum]KKI21382.1 hypothetical protein XM50_02615 [Sphingomonas sp. Ag1]NIJ67314.1 hypothetical protein [Sphingomonas leidyi]NNG57483.1 hypothetical protein [Sphingomonas paucimobilis]
MSNSYTKAAFGIAVTSAEADLLHRVVGAIEMIDDAEIGLDVLEAHYRDLGADFAALFPRTPESPFDGLLDLFRDENYPSLDFDIDFAGPDADGVVVVFLSGEQFGVETAAKLIQRCAPSALPFGFEWASDCDRLRAGEFGGGYVAITADTIEYGHTSLMLDRAIARASDEGADGFVLATRNGEPGLSFWNNEDGFGSLARATVFSETEAAKFDLPIADDQPEWLAMPAPLRL